MTPTLLGQAVTAPSGDGLRRIQGKPHA